MLKDQEFEFKTLLTLTEYERLAEMFKDKPSNFQTNFYFDTRRFTLKASDIGLRVRKRDHYELSLKRKKGYQLQELDEQITEDEFNDFNENGFIPSAKIENEIADILKGQKLINYMSISTHRITFPYKSGIIAIDKCTYFDTTDYELEFIGYSYEITKKDFIQTVKELGITYKKSISKIKRAYIALKQQI